MRPVFVIDINKCVGCMACVAACSVENGVLFIAAKDTSKYLPIHSKTRTVVVWKEEEKEKPARRFVPYLCNHCEKAPCLEVCPTQATYKTKEGIVLIDKDKCIGCRYCIMACPYGMRYTPPAMETKELMHLDFMKDAEAGVNYGGVMFQPPVSNKWAVKIRTVDKCTFCYHRKTSDDKLWTPACVEVCPTKARSFGDLDNPNDPVADLVRRGIAKPIAPSKGTGGLVYYVGGV
ncbi:4Fe-4S ferredoxin, iron-sulfur binding domain protein [Pyrobaculum islandicum DSM 4184]|uniref:4Fe-4S ferredoxin, iron-sulfur binding domain protein n=1 Tax=Pyrobaculum islandicum (strain DSM 4184 / JCM 9189 / GEO3) TaxID=384616 RepID=A1RR62_PYRIL|nr:4Fe-4S dicluster domain-containing protein [Pyrobaculum islandicum]ABL87444.1 4Fe-4S ferredoxin, iron-sulfur binding domain protein [Pyrobaculum islandicum DSM 4184]